VPQCRPRGDAGALVVSILTRRDQRVPPAARHDAHVLARVVSILTRRDQRVPRVRRLLTKMSSKTSFNPHPPRSAGATPDRPRNWFGYVVSILTRRDQRVPPDISTSVLAGLMFQSSPAAISGCHGIDEARWERVVRVSILTRRDQRVPRVTRDITTSLGIKFQSSPAAISGCHLR